MAAAAKAYTATAAFKTDYAEHRAGAKPDSPTTNGSDDQQMKDQLAKMTPSQQAAVRQIYEEQAEKDQAKYKQRMAEWASAYPEQPNAAIAKRLKEFLALTADIDFDVKTEAAGGGKMRFADEISESKSSDWKLCYRAGREPVAAARAFAAEWLHQLGGK